MICAARAQPVSTRDTAWEADLHWSWSYAWVSGAGHEHALSEHAVIGRVGCQPAMQARRSPRSVAVDEIQQEVGLPQ